MPQPSQPASTNITQNAIGVPGARQIDPATGQPIGYTGYTAVRPGVSTPLGYADPMNQTAGSTGTAYQQYTQTQPRYFDGDQWAPANLGVDQMIQLQNGLKSAGLYTGTFTLGVWGVNDVTAYERLLSMSNAAGQDSQTTLQRAVDGAKAGGGTGRAPLVVKLKNDNEIRAILHSAGNDVFGKFLSPEDMQKFIDTYHQQQADYQTAAYSSTGFNPDTGQQDTTGTGGPSGTTLTGPPTDAGGMNLQLQQQMYADHPVTAEMAQFVNQFDALKSTLSQRLPGGGVG